MQIMEKVFEFFLQPTNEVTKSVRKTSWIFFELLLRISFFKEKGHRKVGLASGIK